MTETEHLRVLIGDQILTIAKLAAANDALREQLAALVPEETKPESPPT